MGRVNHDIFWSARACGGVSEALVFDSPESAMALVEDYNICPGFSSDDLEVFDVECGDWQELLAMGICIGDMAFNDPQHVHYKHLEQTQVH